MENLPMLEHSLQMRVQFVILVYSVPDGMVSQRLRD